MAQVVTNNVTAIQPEIWSTMVQIPLYKSLVALEIANMRLSDSIKNGDTIHIPRFGSLSAQTYTPGTSLSATNQDWAFDTLTVSTYKHVTFYVDDVRSITTNIDQARELATEAAYQLKDKIDTHVLANITGTDGFMTCDNADILGGINGAPVSASSANIINVFAGVRAFLRTKNVEETGDWCCVVSPKIAQAIEVKAASVGFNVADSTLRNGYAGDFMGLQVYISNNLPTGNMSAISPAAGAGGIGGLSGANASGTCKGRAMYFGKKGMIDVAMMRAPALEIRKKDDMIGSNFITWTVYGSTVTYNNARRGINLTMGSAFTG